MKTIARILIRNENEAGLFIPMSNHGLKPGLYNLREFLGEHELVYVGSPAMDSKHMSGLSPDDILASRESALMTEAERASRPNDTDQQRRAPGINR